jgi:hypothetical protein
VEAKKVMLDECVTKHCARVVIEYLKLQNPPVESHFLLDFMGTQGALDCDWTTKLVPPEDWIVLSSDAGRSGPRIHAKGPPLHLILPRRKITAFFLRGKSLIHVPGHERARIIISKLPNILELAETASPGQRFTISRSGSGFHINRWDQRGSPA